MRARHRVEPGWKLSKKEGKQSHHYTRTAAPREGQGRQETGLSGSHQRPVAAYAVRSLHWPGLGVDVVPELPGKGVSGFFPAAVVSE